MSNICPMRMMGGQDLALCKCLEYECMWWSRMYGQCAVLDIPATITGLTFQLAKQHEVAPAKEEPIIQAPVPPLVDIEKKRKKQ